MRRRRTARIWSRHVVDIHQAAANGLPRDVDELRSALADDEMWCQEYELEWLDGASAWLPYDLIMACESPLAGDPVAYRGGRVSIGNDIAARGLWVAAALEEVGDVVWTRELAKLKGASFAEHDERLDGMRARGVDALRTHRQRVAALHGPARTRDKVFPPGSIPIRVILSWFASLPLGSGKLHPGSSEAGREAGRTLSSPRDTACTAAGRIAATTKGNRTHGAEARTALDRRRPGGPGHDERRRLAVKASRDSRTGDHREAPMAHVESLLGAVDGVVRDTHVQGRFGDLGPAFAAALGSWIEPFAAAMGEADPLSQAAARAVADLARLTGECAGQAMQSIADLHAAGAGAGSGPSHGELAGRIDDAFRAFSSSPAFDRARRAAATAVLDWLEHDPAAASGLARALEPPPAFALEPFGVPPSPETEPSPRDGNTTLTAFPGAGEARASVLVVPGFTTGPHMFDLDPRRSAVRTLAAHGVDTWLLDWSRCGEAGRHRTVTSRLERIDRAVEAVREAANGRRPALAGHFHGGLLALLYCLRHPGKAAALITLSTPVRFASSDDGFAGWLRACDGERMVDVLGDIPGPLVAALVAASSPMRWCGGGFLELLSGLDSADSADAARRIARFERARRFPPAFPGETFRGLYRAFYRDDSFAAGASAVIDGHRYMLSGLETPLLNVFACDDRIVPPSASAPLAEWAGAGNGSNREHPGGHYELLTGRRAHMELLPGIAGWLVGQAPAS